MPGEGARRAADCIRQARALHRAGRLREALQLYQQALLLAPEEPDGLTYSAAALLALGKPKDAAQRLRASLAARPNHPETLGFLGNALHLSGDVEAAEQSFRDAIDVAPRDPWLRNNLGILLSEQKRRSEAEAHFEMAVVLDPSYAEGANNLSQICLKRGQCGRAIAAAEQAVEHAPKAAQHRNCLGNALAHAGRYEEAVVSFRHALTLRPKYVAAFNNLALALIAAGEPAEALAVTRQCTAVDPGNVTALAARSVALGELGDEAGRAALVDVDRLLQRFTLQPDEGHADLAGFNAALARHVSTHPTLRHAPEDHATRGGQHSGDLLREPQGPIAGLRRRILDAAERYLAALPPGFVHPFLDRRTQSWDIDMWAVIMREQGHQVSHIHPSGWLSGVYYVQVKDAVAASGHEGWIEFGRPQTIYRAKAEPRVTLVRPIEGELLLFPSFFFHRTIAYEAQAERICIAFDLCPPGQRGKAAA